jgi:hypothetical protein
MILSNTIETVRDAMIKRLVKVIHSFRGHVWGDFVVALIGGEKNAGVAVINCTMAIKHIKIFVANISIDYVVTNAAVGADDNDVTNVFHVRDGSGFCAVVLRVDGIVHDLGHAPIHLKFDVDSVRLSACHMYTTASSSTMMDAARDPKRTLMYIVDRIRKRRFALLDRPMDGHFGPKEHSSAMTVAEGRVVNGWIMDSEYDVDSWIINTWVTLKKLPYIQKRPDAKKVASQFDQCPICCEHFEDDAVVVNLKCNHNFHLFCSKAKGGGLHAWLSENQTSCPCCRVQVV